MTPDEMQDLLNELAEKVRPFSLDIKQAVYDVRMCPSTCALCLCI
jgi:hypothetical protein